MPETLAPPAPPEATKGFKGPYGPDNYGSTPPVSTGETDGWLDGFGYAPSDSFDGREYDTLVETNPLDSVEEQPVKLGKRRGRVAGFLSRMGVTSEGGIPIPDFIQDPDLKDVAGRVARRAAAGGTQHLRNRRGKISPIKVARAVANPLGLKRAAVGAATEAIRQGREEIMGAATRNNAEGGPDHGHSAEQPDGQPNNEVDDDPFNYDSWVVS